MIYTNEIVIAQDMACRDMYICRSLCDQDQQRNIAVEIFEIIAYPFQHAIMHPDVADEHPPLLPGAKVYLTYTARCTGLQPVRGRLIPEQEYRLALGARLYWTGFTKCLNGYEDKIERAIRFQSEHPSLAEAQRLLVDPAELKILRRHRRREFNGRRSVLEA